jgi:lipopolysaccharide biosynthesis regulator YciM
VSIPDLLWLLLPIAAAAGWFAAKRNDARKTRAFWDYTSDFHQGLKVLLSDKQDKPVELFSNATSTDRNAADTHIALGNHYRRRGDMERSVFMHQSVLDNEALDDDVRAAARFELARDYDSAGMLDRSEAEFKELIKSEHRLDDAYQSLLQLHERESDWNQAIKVALEAERDTDSEFGHRVAHYYCELALESIKQEQIDSANSQLSEALEHDKTCARASMMLAELALEAGDFSQANTLYERVETLRPELMPEIIDRRFEVLRQAGDAAQFDRFLKRIHSQRNAYSVIRSTRSVIAERHNPQLADRFFKDQILKRPSLKGLRDWAHDQVELSKPDEREKVQVICDLLDKVVEDKPAYRCNQCGFQGNVMHWRCPSCEQWDSVSTIIGVEGE